MRPSPLKHWLLTGKGRRASFHVDSEGQLTCLLRDDDDTEGCDVVGLGSGETFEQAAMFALGQAGFAPSEPYATDDPPPKLDGRPSRQLTDRECAVLIGGTIGCLVTKFAPADTVRRATQWWARVVEPWLVLDDQAEEARQAAMVAATHPGWVSDDEEASS